MCGSGKLYGVGVGPGDPELLTLKAYRILERVEYWAHPGKSRENSIALQIAKQAVGNWAKKKILDCPVPMNKEIVQLEEAYRTMAKDIATILRKGEDVAFLNLGDPTVYGSFCYLAEQVRQEGFEVEMVSAVPSFCAAAAAAEISLCERNEQLHVIPASYEVREALLLPGTKVFMKAGKELEKLLKTMEELRKEGILVKQVGMPGQRMEKVPGAKVGEDYLTLVIVKE
ncbi:MAG: precorrin-2 C(20)-methyltransferase [Lachnospiraceae bacterium]|nr:precorrin-2 C(20)-methyltransferase [Lachnospiraceae bacterium]